MNKKLTAKVTFCTSVLIGAIPGISNTPCTAGPKTPKNDERPNILWLTFEDMSWFLIGCYGNSNVSTPNIDSLAANGIQYMNAWSNAPQSSPARSSLITGCYATTYGMDLHPVEFPTPDNIFFPQFLKEAGYYCTNNSKTHYNTTVSHSDMWDECSQTASYNSPNKPAGKPFFSVFNTVTSHMGRVRTFHTEGRRDYSLEGIYMDSLTLPPHIPHLPEMYSDYAGHLEAAQDVDTWVGFFLKDLKEKGLQDNTIIYIFSDHGGVLPRGKGYLFETGLRVPMVAYFPPKWRHLTGSETGVNDESLVSFVDMGPTMLSIAGVKPPKYMQGKSVLGEYADKTGRELQYGFAANQLHHFMPVRAVSDGRYKYIRPLIPYKQFALRNYYQWGMPSNQAWDNYAMICREQEPKQGQKTWGFARSAETLMPYRHNKPEMLFDISKDMFELNDLSGDPQYAEILTGMRNALDKHIESTGDLGFFVPTEREGVSMYNRVKETKYPLKELQKLATMCGMANAAELSEIEKYLRSEHPSLRFWAVAVYAQALLDGTLQKAPEALEKLINDSDLYVSAEACFANAYCGRADEAISKLLSFDPENIRIAYSLLEALTLDDSMHKYFTPYIDKIKEHARALPAKQNEDAGYMARGVLANLKLIFVKDIYGPKAYEQGFKLNAGRRPMLPLP